MNAPLATTKTAPTVVHLFAGSGGCTLWFQRAGFRSLGSFDFDPAACRDLVRLTGGPAALALVDAVVNPPQPSLVPALVAAMVSHEAPEAGSDWDATMTRAQMEISDLRTAACQPDAILRRLTGAADVLRERDATMCEVVGDARDLIARMLKPCDSEAAKALLGRLWEDGQRHMFGGGDTDAGIKRGRLARLARLAPAPRDRGLT